MRAILLAAAVLAALPSQAQTQCATVATLSCPTMVAGALSSSDCTASDNSYYDLWQFSGTAGQTVTIDMHSTAFDTYLVLIDPADTPVADNDDASRTDKNSSITYSLPSAGTWTIVVNSLTAGRLGDYDLSLSSSSCVSAGPRRRVVRQ